MLLAEDGEAQEAWSALKVLFNRAKNCGIHPDRLVFDPALARGLDYYTGAIFEVRVDDAPVGSICGGGRYADLTGIFGWEGMSGVGISFGADRIYDVLEHFNCFPEEASVGSKVMVLQMDAEGVDEALQLLQALRESGVAAELYPDPAKMKKQLKHASDLNVQFVAMRGEQERTAGHWTLRNMRTGDQVSCGLEELLEKVV